MNISWHAYFNPFSTQFHAVSDFTQLPSWKKKTAVIAMTFFVSLLTLGIGSVAVFRVMTRRMMATKIDEKTSTVARSTIPPKVEKTPPSSKKPQPERKPISTKPIVEEIQVPSSQKPKTPIAEETSEKPILKPSTITNPPQKPKIKITPPPVSQVQKKPSETKPVAIIKEPIIEEESAVEPKISDSDLFGSYLEDEDSRWIQTEDFVLEFTPEGSFVPQRFDFSKKRSIPSVGPEKTAKEKGVVSPVSQETLESIDVLNAFLTKNNLKKGEANDTGDCFYHAVAQTLSVALKEPITIETLRKVVHDYAQNLHTKFIKDLSKELGKEVTPKILSDLTEDFVHHSTTLSPNVSKLCSENWILVTKGNEYQEFLDEVLYSEDMLINAYNEKIAKDGAALNTLIDQANRQRETTRLLIQKFNQEDSPIDFSYVAAAAEEYKSLEDKIAKLRPRLSAPYWGDLYVDGRIISEHYNVDIVTYSATTSSVSERKKPTELEHPKETIRIAQYPGHFVPVF